MERARAILGLIAGAFLILSSAAHSFLGWPELRPQLEAAGVPGDLAFGLKVGWQFGGAAMFAFGVITIAQFANRLRGQRVSSVPGLVIAAVYLPFGLWAMLANGFNPFFLVFVAPALLLIAACWNPPAGPAS